MEDLALEYQLTAPSSALRASAALLGPLAANPDLVATLDEFVGSGADRRRTATALHVHVNTVDNRLNRVQTLIGIDPTDPMGFVRLVAAQRARARLTSHPSRPEEQ